MGVNVDLKQRMLEGNIKKTEQFTRGELDKGIPWSDLLEKILIPIMDEIGQEFSNGSLFLPELMAAGIAMSKAVEVIKERLGDRKLEPKGTMVLGTIYDDVHDIGKNIVKMNLEAAGFRVIDLGIDVQPERFIKSSRESKADLIGISALLTATMLNLGPAIRQIREEVPGSKIMVGGNPVTAEFAEKIGADGYAPDGYLAVKRAKELLGLE
ncbi:MAG: cobalamin-dependent protein [Deltaproteobacteria bacterium]|nr:cobalamin-dependent protein [Deltaproteobacteria bacterium]MBW2136593.1 cobalamin-dependent protein [Deltaproteobacteria bacterium]